MLCVFLALLTVSQDFLWLVICLFGAGIALGGDYPTAHLIISEAIPSSTCGKLVLSAFGFQAVGALSGTMIGSVVLSNLPELDAWRWMYAAALIPAILLLIGRFRITESAPCLLAQGRTDAAETATLPLRERSPPYPTKITLVRDGIDPQLHGHSDGSRFSDLFKRRHRRATILAAVPWFLQDLGTYGIGIFTPLVLAASFAKIGAVTTVFLFPILLADIGEQLLLWILVGTSLLGALITRLCRIETTGKDLEQL